MEMVRFFFMGKQQLGFTYRQRGGFVTTAEHTEQL